MLCCQASERGGTAHTDLVELRDGSRPRAMRGCGDGGVGDDVGRQEVSRRVHAAGGVLGLAGTWMRWGCGRRIPPNGIGSWGGGGTGSCWGSAATRLWEETGSGATAVRRRAAAGEDREQGRGRRKAHGRGMKPAAALREEAGGRRRRCRRRRTMESSWR